MTWTFFLGEDDTPTEGRKRANIMWDMVRKDICPHGVVRLSPLLKKERAIWRYL